MNLNRLLKFKTNINNATGKFSKQTFYLVNSIEYISIRKNETIVQPSETAAKPIGKEKKEARYDLHKFMRYSMDNALLFGTIVKIKTNVEKKIIKFNKK
jgi:hypothetical protein